MMKAIWTSAYGTFISKIIIIIIIIICLSVKGGVDAYISVIVALYCFWKSQAPIRRYIAVGQ